MPSWLYIFVGCGLGSMCRYAMSVWLPRATAAHFPWATLATNALGCLLIGLWLGYLEARPSRHLALLFVTGFCGGFTTFSTFSADTLGLLRQGLYLAAATYAAVSLLGGLLLAGCGYWLSMRLFMH